MPEIAVIVAAYIRDDLGLRWLEEAALSVVNQTFADWELIIVDDCSPLKFNLVVEEPIRLLRHDRQRGPGAARNTAVAASKAPWIIALDSDDRLPVDALEKLYAARCLHGVRYGDVRWIGDVEGNHKLDEWSFEALLKLNGLLPVTALHHRSAWKAVGGWSESLSGLEDQEYWVRLAAQGICGERVDVTTLEYRRHGESRQRQLEANNKRALTEVVKQIRQKHAALYQRVGTMACKNCPGGTGPGNGATFMAEGLGPDTVELKYTGPRLGSFTVFSHKTSIKYRVQGKGARITVDRRDLEWFQLMGQAEYIIVTPEPPPPAIAIHPQIAPEIPKITDFNVKAAQAAIKESTEVLDLRVWLAEERAEDEPRETVITAIEKRLAALSNDD